MQGATSSPGLDWTHTMTQGLDCNDDVSSADNSVCSVSTIPCTNKTVCSAGYSLVNCECVQDPLPDPCDEIKKALADANYKAIMTELQSSATLSKHNETGYWQDNKGEYHPMEINGIRAAAMPDDVSTMENFTHAHMNDWTDPVTGTINESYPMPSAEDIAKVYALNYNSRSNGLNFANTYVGNTSRLGSFQMRYVGNPDDLTAVNFNKIYDAIKTQENEDAYKLVMKQNDDGVAGLLAVLRDILKITDIAVYQIETAGASKLELDTNNQIKKTPCN